MRKATESPSSAAAAIETGSNTHMAGVVSSSSEWTGIDLSASLRVGGGDCCTEESHLWAL